MALLTERSLEISSISPENQSQRKILMRCLENRTQTKMERLILMVRLSMETTQCLQYCLLYYETGLSCSAVLLDCSKGKNFIK